MSSNQDKINSLLYRLQLLSEQQDDLSRNLNKLRIDILQLKSTEDDATTHAEPRQQNNTVTAPPVEAIKDKGHDIHKPAQQPERKGVLKNTFSTRTKSSGKKSNLEKFIGENLISKIGIIITVIGVAIGAKYAIDHQLISPLTRIVLGYLFGLGLLGFAIKLKKKYDNFSSVLLSGAMAIIYFITYFAYSLYNLIPQGLAFVLMVAFTVFTVIAAVNYNKQVIAHVGLVGAYAVPFLLSNGAGNPAILFTYMAIINIGILAISFKKYWKPLYFSSFGLTWIIYVSWWLGYQYGTDHYFGLALSFLTLFFCIFYLTFLGYKLLKKEEFGISDISLLLANSFIFFGIGYSILSKDAAGGQLLGIFTLCNAIIHFMVSLVIRRYKLADRNLFYLVSGLVLVFITIAIPVQLDGHWVTLLWAGEAALVFWIGRTKKVVAYEVLSYPLMLLASLSLVQDWSVAYGFYYYGHQTTLKPIFNVTFLTSILFIAAFSFINILIRNRKYSPSLKLDKTALKLVSAGILAILLVALYFTFRLEISNYWERLYLGSAVTITPEARQTPQKYFNQDLQWFKTIWIINYSLFFVSLLTILNLRKFKARQWGPIIIALNAAAILIFMTQGLYILSELRESYLGPTPPRYFHGTIFNLGIRYVSFVFIAMAIVCTYKYIREEYNQRTTKIITELSLHLVILWIVTSELINWMDLLGSAASYKIGLSILWGIYSLFLITLGIWKSKKYLRIGAIVLFGVTLLKLFFYDIAYLDTISKTIVLVSLGVLLLIISFLYNKFKSIIANEAGE